MKRRARVRLGRRGRSALTLTVLYALALILAPVSHRHDHGHDHDSAPTHLAGCEDFGSHWAGHTHAPELSTESTPCPACQQRADVPFWRAECARFVIEEVAPHIDRHDIVVVATRARLFSSRGPPQG